MHLAYGFQSFLALFDCLNFIQEAEFFDLFDLHGNVWEWVYDLHQSNYEALPGVDPVNNETGSGRVGRGGSWGFNAQACRAAVRFNSVPGNRFNFLGFRLVRSID